MFMGLAKCSGWNILYVHTVNFALRRLVAGTAKATVISGRLGMTMQQQQEDLLVTAFRQLSQHTKDAVLRFILLEAGIEQTEGPALDPRPSSDRNN
jgi:hypothetical protein